MANLIQLKYRSAADANAPGSLADGELAVQMQDKKSISRPTLA